MLNKGQADCNWLIARVQLLVERVQGLSIQIARVVVVLSPLELIGKISKLFGRHRQIMTLIFKQGAEFYLPFKPDQALINFRFRLKFEVLDQFSRFSPAQIDTDSIFVAQRRLNKAQGLGEIYQEDSSSVTEHHR